MSSAAMNVERRMERKTIQNRQSRPPPPPKRLAGLTLGPVCCPVMRPYCSSSTFSSSAARPTFSAPSHWPCWLYASEEVVQLVRGVCELLLPSVCGTLSEWCKFRCECEAL